MAKTALQLSSTQPLIEVSSGVLDNSELLPVLQPDTLVPVMVAQTAAAPAFQVIYIDPTAPYGGDGSMANPYNSWYAFTLQAGDIALQRGGTITSGFTITAQGTTGFPIVIGSYGTGLAQIQGSIALSGATNVTLSGLDITGGTAYGVVLSNDAASCVVQNCNIHGGIAGVLITGATSNSNVISNNQIYENDTAGIWFDGANASAGQETLVIGNTIYRNGEQGISLHSSHVIVDSNTIVNNGIAGLPGISAIHVYGQSTTDTSGQNNVISNNIIADQRDGSSLDGNGIQLDAYSGGNAVIGNQIFGNDGAGINLFSSSNNLVMNNTLQGNMVDSGGTHVISKAEIYLGETSVIPATGNVITSNTIVANSTYGAAVQVDALANQNASNVFTGNSIAQTGSGALWMWGTQTGTTAAGWDGLARSGSDSAWTGGLGTLPTFSSSILDRTFTLHSTTFILPSASSVSLLVAYAGNENRIGGPMGSWMAGDGQNNILLAGGGDSLISAGSGNATILGQSGNDFFFGGSGNNLMIAGSGNTVMIGGSGSSHMIGGAGTDLIFAGNGTGTDILDGGTGNNTLVGGGGPDTFVLGSSGVDYISGFKLAQDHLDVSDFGVTSMTGLQIFSNGNAGVIEDQSGVIHAVIVGIDATKLTVSNFIFAPTV